MIEEFIIKLEDGTQVKVAGELLNKKLPSERIDDLITTLKTSNLEDVLLEMSQQITSMGNQIQDIQDATKG